MRNMCSVGRAFFTLVSGVYSLWLSGSSRRVSPATSTVRSAYCTLPPPAALPGPHGLPGVSCLGRPQHSHQGEQPFAPSAPARLRRAPARLARVSLIEAAQSSQTDVVPPAGRRLLALTHAAVAATSAKVWLWALPPKQFQLAALLASTTLTRCCKAGSRWANNESC